MIFCCWGMQHQTTALPGCTYKTLGAQPCHCSGCAMAWGALVQGIGWAAIGCCQMAAICHCCCHSCHSRCLFSSYFLRSSSSLACSFSLLIILLNLDWLMAANLCSLSPSWFCGAPSLCLTSSLLALSLAAPEVFDLLCPCARLGLGVLLLLGAGPGDLSHPSSQPFSQPSCGQLSISLLHPSPLLHP